MEKWVDRKYFNFFHFVWLGVEKGGMEKMSLNKFTHIPLLNNDTKLKQKKNDK